MRGTLLNENFEFHLVKTSSAGKSVRRALQQEFKLVLCEGGSGNGHML